MIKLTISIKSCQEKLQLLDKRIKSYRECFEKIKIFELIITNIYIT